MKKVLLSVVAIAGVGGLIALLAFHPKSETLGASTKSDPPASSPDSSSSDSPATNSGAAASGTYKDGTYTGSTVNVGYGPVQVQAVITGGKITGVNFLQMPSDQSHSTMVADEAKPVLLKEALQAQSANVDSVSGATQDSQGFTQSLQSALTQAKA